MLRRFLAEDLGDGDLTTASVVPDAAEGRARWLAKAEGVVAGLRPSLRVFELLDPGVAIEARVSDGAAVVPGTVLAEFRGNAAGLLAGERTALNLAQRLSGIATLTARFVAAVSGTGCQIFDTRKTTPGLRYLEREAVRAGGGVNHRAGLFDQILIKENHIDLIGPGRPVAEAVRRARSEGRSPIEVEVQSTAEALVAQQAGADIILLDNFSLPELAAAVAALREEVRNKRVILEASGGVRLDTVRPIAATGVDRISVGALTHSAPALDISMLLLPGAP